MLVNVVSNPIIELGFPQPPQCGAMELLRELVEL